MRAERPGNREVRAPGRSPEGPGGRGLTPADCIVVVTAMRTDVGADKRGHFTVLPRSVGREGRGGGRGGEPESA